MDFEYLVKFDWPDFAPYQYCFSGLERSQALTQHSGCPSTSCYRNSKDQALGFVHSGVRRRPQRSSSFRRGDGPCNYVNACEDEEYRASNKRLHQLLGRDISEDAEEEIPDKEADNLLARDVCRGWDRTFPCVEARPDGSDGYCGTCAAEICLVEDLV